MAMNCSERERLSFHTYATWLEPFKCSTLRELYNRLSEIVKANQSLKKIPFSLSDLENPPNNIGCHDVSSFIYKCLKVSNGDDSDEHAIDLIAFLKDNPPEVSYENPGFPEGLGFFKTRARNFMQHVVNFGLELPGSMHNPYGMAYFSNFFIDMFFGNYTEFIAHIDSLSKEELKKEMERREGHCQYSLAFIPILGMRMVNLDKNKFFSSKVKQEIRMMYHGENENKHVEILEKLLQLGADPNAFDIFGMTPLHYALDPYCHACIQFVSVLLKYGADPNSQDHVGDRPLTKMITPHMKMSDKDLELVDILIEHKAKLNKKMQVNNLRKMIEVNGSTAFAVKVREALPRENNVCEKCEEPAEKKCSACKHVFYCSQTCQKLDWKFHKTTCHKNRNTTMK